MCRATPTASGSQTPLAQPSVTTAELCKQSGAAQSGCKSFVFGLPPNAKAPICRLFPVAAAQVPPQEDNLKVFDIACSDVPTIAPTTEHPTGQTAAEKQQEETKQKGEQQQQQQQQQQPSQTQQNGQKQQKRAACGAAPTGPATNAPAPLLTSQAIVDAPACLAQCKATPGCQSIEFGKPSPNEPVRCILFSVPSTEVPPPATGATYIAYDVGC
jgi:Tfp pilus assembly protein FimV